MKKYVINSNICKSCDNCSSNCPTGAIDTNDKGEYVIDQTVCIGCGNCNNICPVGAIEEKEAFNTVGDFNTQFKNCSGFEPYKKNNDKFVINEELSEMFSSSGAGNVDLTGYDNKKFTTSFPAWVDNFICIIKFNTIEGTLPKIKCIENTHVQHTKTSNTIYGCFPLVIDENDNYWSMQFAFKENISVGTEIDFSNYIKSINNADYSYYNTEPIIHSNAKDYIYYGGHLCLYKDKPNENLFASMHDEHPVL